jgi:formate dehydrogenase beta subunit
VARDLAPLGYEVTVFDGEAKAGGFIRTQIPRFRLPEGDRRGDRLHPGPGRRVRGGQRIDSMKALLARATTRSSSAAARRAGATSTCRAAGGGGQHPHRHRLAVLGLVRPRHKIGKRVIVLGGGNTAMDCCRSRAAWAATDVKVIVRSGFEEMKASPWEKEDAMHEGIPILNFHVPKAFVHENGKLTGMPSRLVKAERTTQGPPQLVPTGEPDAFFECDDVLVAVGQENAFPWIERDCGIVFDKWGLPKLDKNTFQSTVPNVFFGGDAAFGPKNIIWAVAHGHEAAVSIDKLLHGEPRSTTRPPPTVNLMSQKMGIHEWSYDNDTSNDLRYKVPLGQGRDGAGQHQGGGGAGLRRRHRLQGSPALPELRRADRVHRSRLHRVRRLRRHLPDGLHHLHRQRRGGRPAHAPEGAGAQPAQDLYVSGGSRPGA